jgi:hypothetical protein
MGRPLHLIFEIRLHLKMTMEFSGEELDGAALKIKWGGLGTGGHPAIFSQIIAS